MRKLFSIIILLCISALCFAQRAGSKISFTAVDMTGKTVTSDIFSKNKLTLVNIWGTFCPPCIREMPELAKLNESNKDIEVVGIVIDITDRKGNVNPKLKSDGDKIIAQTGANYVHIIPNQEMMSTFLRNIQAVPATIFVDSNGNQVGDMHLGARSQKDWQKLIDKLLSTQK